MVSKAILRRRVSSSWFLIKILRLDITSLKPSLKYCGRNNPNLNILSEESEVETKLSKLLTSKVVQRNSYLIRSTKTFGLLKIPYELFGKKSRRKYV